MVSYKVENDKIAIYKFKWLQLKKCQNRTFYEIVNFKGRINPAITG